jgi:hypothetical protein
MKKEVLIAIVIGFALGLLITFGIWTANKALKTQSEVPTEETKTETTVEPTPTPAGFTLSILSPEDEALIDTSKTELKGLSIANAVIVIVAEKEEKIIEADENGSFATEVSLVRGINEITVTAFNQEGEKTSQTLNVVYSTAEI